MLTIGLLTRDPFDRRTAPMLLGVLERLTEHDIAFLVCDGRGDPIREQFFVDSLRRREVDGYLVAGSSPGSFSRRSLGIGLGAPTVYAMTTSTDPDDISVVPDNRGGATDAIRHLVSTGRRRIAAIFGPADEDAARLKTDASVETLAEYGLSFATDPLYGTWDEAWGHQATAQLVHSGASFDGVVCGNDAIARGSTAALQDLGISVPDDVGVIGFDNWRTMVEANRPRLTSVDLMLPVVGRVAADKLISAVHGSRPAGGMTIIPSRLVPRESTAVSSRVARPSARRLVDEAAGGLVE